MLLAAYDARRPTRDVDLQGRHIRNDSDQVRRHIRNDSDQVRQTVQTIARIDLDDGLQLDADHATAENIRDDDTYSGVRVTLTGTLSVARLSFHVDVNVGDPIWPAPQRIALPRLLDGQIELVGYPLPMVHAEKLVTAIQRGVANTRWRDFSDIYVLARRHDIEGTELTSAIQRVAQYRQVGRVPLNRVLDGYAALAQQRWAAWRRKHRLGDRLPEQFGDVLTGVTAFADPGIDGTAAGHTWKADERTWKPRRSASREPTPR